MDLNINKISQKTVTDPSQMKDGKELFSEYNDGPIDIENLPDVDYIIDEINKILEVMATPEMMTARAENENMFRQMIEDKFPQFSLRFYGILLQIFNGADLDPLWTMLSAVKKMKLGASAEKEEEKVGSYLRKRFDVDKILDKVQADEKAMAARDKKNKK